MDLLQEALFTIKENTLGQLVCGAFSGGKDSIVVKRICDIAGLKINWHYHNTTIDPPDVFYFIKKEYKDVIIDKPKHGNLFKRIKEKGILPSFKHRWCCDEYKESRGVLNTVWITGERREESYFRANQPMVGLQKRSRRVIIRPLANWTEEDIWDFIKSEKLVYPSLYDEGFSRLGCIGCPLATRANREWEFKCWPRYKAKWIDAAKYIYESKRFDNFINFEEYFECWMDHKI